MSQSIQNYNNLKQNNYAVQNPNNRNVQQKPVAVRLPDYYTPDNTFDFKENLEKNPLYSVFVNGFFGPFINHPIASILTWFGCGFLLDKYTEAGNGEYRKSIFKKAVDFGDNIENSKFIQSKPVQKVLSFFKSGGKKFSKIIDNNSVLKAMRDTPTMPEWEIVKSEMMPQRLRVVHDFNYIATELKLDSKELVPLNHLDVTSKEKDMLKKFFKVSKISDIPEEFASSFVQLKRIDKSEDFIKNALRQEDGGIGLTKQEILKAMGVKDAAWLKKVREDTIGNYVEEVQAATKKVGNKVRISLCDYKPLGIDLGFLTKPCRRTLGCDNVYNRLHSLEEELSKNKCAKTATGRFMSKFMQLIHRGLTFGGGKWGVLLFIAPAFVETAINVYKAEPKEKLGTGVSNLTNHISWVFTFPLALQIMHHILGAQYAGLSKDTVQQIRDLQNNFNHKNNMKGVEGEEQFKDYKAWNKARNRVNAKIAKLKEVPKQKWYTKFVRKLAGALTPDLGKLDAYNPGNFIGRKFYQLRNLPRNLWGVPVRLGLFMFLTMGVLDAILNKGIKLIFGNSYNSAKEEEIKESKKEQKNFLKEDLNERLYEAQRNKIINSAKNQKQNLNTQMQNTVSHKGAANVNNLSSGDTSAPNRGMLVYPTSSKMKNVSKKEKIDNYTYIPSQENVIPSSVGKSNNDTYTYIPSQDSTIKSDNDKNSIRSYIPSQKGANIQKSWDNSGLNAALRRADRAENKALKILAGNFEQ